MSDQFLGGATAFRRYQWPVEFVVRAIKEAGWRGLSADAAIAPLASMGQQLYEPPDVNGWALGAEWFSTAMLARMNFAATLAANQRFNLARDAQPFRQAPERVLEYLPARFQNVGFSEDGRAALLEYLTADIAWPGSDAEWNAKLAGAARLVIGAGEYQFNEGPGIGSRASMKVSRRTFVRGGVTAFSLGFAAPRVLCDIAFAQSGSSRNLVVVYLGGGNDALSTVIPYRDSSHYERRPTLAVPAGEVLQIGRDASGVELGPHPRLTGLKGAFDAGRLAIIQRTGYANQSRSHFTGFDILGTADPQNAQGTGWLGRLLDSLPPPVDPPVGWNTQRETPRPLMGRLVGVPSITSPAACSFASAGGPAEGVHERAAQARIFSHPGAVRRGAAHL